MPRHLTGEALIQATVMAHLRAHGVAAFHVPNETQGPVQWLSKRKALGVEAGVPDIIIPVTPPNWGPPRDITICGGHIVHCGAVGAVLELKDERGKLSDAQRRWLATFRAAQFLTAVPRSEYEALDILQLWGYLPRTVPIGSEEMRRRVLNWDMLPLQECPSSAPSHLVSRSSASAKPRSSRASTRRRSR